MLLPVRKFILIFLMLLIGGCSTSSPSPTPTYTGDGRILGISSYSDAPRMTYQDRMLYFAWVAERESQTRLMVRSLEKNETILALDTYTPHQIKLLPASKGLIHLIWRDLNQDDQSVISHATFNTDLIAELDVDTLNSEAVLEIGSSGTRDPGQVAIAWSAPPLDEPALFLSQLDEKGRAKFPQRIAGDFERWVLGQNQEIYWVNQDGFFQARLTGAALEDSQQLGSTKSLYQAAGLIEDMQIAESGDHTLLIWNTVADGVWYSLSEAGHWSKPQALKIGADVIERASIGSDGETLYLAGVSGSKLAVYSYQTHAWLALQTISEHSASASSPQILLAEDSIHITWAEVDAYDAQFILLYKSLPIP